MESPDPPIPVFPCCVLSLQFPECVPLQRSEMKKEHTDDHSHTDQAFLRRAVLAFREPGRPDPRQVAAPRCIARLLLRDKRDELSQTTFQRNVLSRDSCATSTPSRWRAAASMRSSKAWSDYRNVQFIFTRKARL